jgi:hypothetical protein
MKELNLTLHCGGYRTDLATVEQVPTPKPERRWYPIPHIDVHRCIERAVASQNLRIVSQIHALARNGNHYFGMYQVVNGHENNEMGFVIGSRNSHDKQFVAGLAAGDGVFACDNLAFWADVVLGRMHTTNILRDLPLLCNRAVGILAEKWTDMEQRVTAYKSHTLKDEQVHDFVIRAVDAGAITTTAIPDVLKEWRTPSHEEFAADGASAWRLRNAFTESYKAIANPIIMTRRSQILNGLLDTTCGLVRKDKPVIEVDASTN